MQFHTNFIYFFETVFMVISLGYLAKKSVAGPVFLYVAGWVNVIIGVILYLNVSGYLLKVEQVISVLL
ncbi:hypothetical protein [Paraflavitalea speifideaquila]|uniref:hypothetical protein n=1 Tax=Paraflavitalea speifideaquila TaxID=3076558 RepID=UPI0028ED0822|nr:hypothetical protein [Paraflavitalea speifideiaquila]